MLADGGWEEGRMGNGGSAKQGVAAVQGVPGGEWRGIEGRPRVEKCWVQACKYKGSMHITQIYTYIASYMIDI